MLQLGFEQIVTTILDDLSTTVEMSTLPRTNDAAFFYPCLKSCAHPESGGGTCEGADDPVRVLGKWKSKNPELKGNI
jgi:hypothetical protein